ncbi:unnamed protein product [Amaranthus hypochondriacus]
MVFSSLPLYHLDTHNWHQQSNEEHLIIPTHHDSSGQYPLPGAPHNHGGGGGGGNGPTSSVKPNSMVDRARQAQIPLPEAGLKCPRCESTNTKFCYFNNYSLTQPRHFCKTCRRYWTRGGALRNVPVGGGSRRTTKRTKGKNNNSINNNNISNNNNNNDNNANANNNASINLFLTPNNLPQLPFLPSSLLSNPNPNGIGLNLLGHGGVEMEFPLMGNNPNFNGMQMINPFDHNSSHGSYEILGGRLIPKSLDPHHEMIDRVASVKLEDSHQGLSLSKEFVLDHHNHYNNWNTSSTNVWANSDLSGFTSPSSNSHLLG